MGAKYFLEFCFFQPTLGVVRLIGLAYDHVSTWLPDDSIQVSFKRSHSLGASLFCLVVGGHFIECLCAILEQAVSFFRLANRC